MEQFLSAHGEKIENLHGPVSFGNRMDSIRLFERRLDGNISHNTRQMILSLLSCLHESRADKVGIAVIKLKEAEIFLYADENREYIGSMIFPQKAGEASTSP
ncbi:MAG: hypothetical protein Q4G14_08740 [Paracoccus sp. (in: a-proteobacteria)]|nr:hypothetical protein [Paracoccus sp. (in: a-proteobacteria)]